MKRNLLSAAVAAAVVLLAGSTTATAGGDKCAAQHTQADYQKMADKLAKKGWLGIETEKTAAGYAVSSVAPGSPAERAGFRVGDVLLGLNGVSFGDENKEAIAKVKSTLAPGSAVASPQPECPAAANQDEKAEVGWKADCGGFESDSGRQEKQGEGDDRREERGRRASVLGGERLIARGHRRDDDDQPHQHHRHEDARHETRGAWRPSGPLARPAFDTAGRNDHDQRDRRDERLLA